MAFSYDPSTPRGQVRLLVSDTDDQHPDRQVFTDAEIDAFIGLAKGLSVFGAAAMALRSIAANEVQVLKVIKSLDLDTDGAATARAIKELADAYEARAEEELGPAAGFEIAEWVGNAFQTRQRLVNEHLRQGV